MRSTDDKQTPCRIGSGPVANPLGTDIPAPPVPVGASRPSGRGAFCDAMRSVPSGSFLRLSQLTALWRAYLRCRMEKRRQPAMATFDLDTDQHVLGLYRSLRDGTYRPGRYRLHIIRDPKIRLIAAAPIVDRVLHRALIGELAPHYEPSFLPHSFSASIGRGPHRALLCYWRYLRQFRFRLSLDIRRYFPSIRHDTLLTLFFHRLHDPKTRALLTRLLSSGGRVYRSALAMEALGLAQDPVPEGCGLPIGSYVSQWSGSFYLDGLDHFVKRTLKIPGYLRYMDDFSLFCDDEATLQSARDSIGEWLCRERGLSLNRKRWAVLPTTEPSRFMGYRVSRGGVAPSPKVRRRARRRLQEAAARGEVLLRAVCPRIVGSI